MDSSHLLWDYLTGVVFVGTALLVDKQARAAATWPELMTLLVEVIVYVPVVVAKPGDIGNALVFWWRPCC